MRGNTRILLAFLAVICFQAPLFAADAVIKGVVTDNAGKPVRGAIVKAIAGYKTVTRFSQNDGRYEITVPAGSYDLMVDAYGFAVKRQSIDTTKMASTDFRLTPKFDVARLSGSEMESLLPDAPDARQLKSRCIDCHSFPTVMNRRGSTAAEWKAFLPGMTRDTMGQPYANSSDATLTVISNALAKYFGPDSPYFGPDADPPSPSQVEHVDLSDDALRATVVEYDTPTAGSMPHSIEIDTKANVAWFAEYSWIANKIGRFDIATEKFQEFPMLTPRATPHTGAVGKDGTFWVALAHANDPAKLASVDSHTGVVTQYDWPEKKAPAHTMTLDHQGNVWFSSVGATGELWMFDVETKKYKAFKNPIAATYPKGSRQEWEFVPGQPTTASNGSYDVAVDNEGMVWFSEINIGSLVRLNPATGEVKDFRPERTVSIRGITVDPQDNLWFGDFHGHRLGKMNVKTGEVKFYQPPTPNATPYGFAIEEKTGNVWFADENGNNITRFNPKTERFTEFRIPNPARFSYARFIGLDTKGRVWFTEFFGAKIGYVDPNGEQTSVASAR